MHRHHHYADVPAQILKNAAIFGGLSVIRASLHTVAASKVKDA
jgi:hypothetical protein